MRATHDEARTRAAQSSSMPESRTALLESLGALHAQEGPLTPELLDELSARLGLRPGDVHPVASSYANLGLARDAVRVCTGPLCSCLGGRAADGEVETACLGHCDTAPAAFRDGELVGRRIHRTNRGPSIDLGGLDEPRPAVAVSPEDLLAELRSSGLTGMGGAGFPTWRKWEAVLSRPGPRALVVNADEGEPGTFKDRYLLELRPQLVLEGIRHALRFTGADEAIVYLRGEYAAAGARLAREAAARSLPLRIVLGAGSYVCGEETALLESLEGRRGMPRLRPPFPAERGYLGMPTLIDNVETLAHVPAIVRNGGAWWAALGEAGAAGTRLYSVSGAVRRPGCYEAPAGATLARLVDLAGGPTDGISCLVPGGAASGILPPSALDTPFTRDALGALGASPGTAAVQVFPTSVSPLEVLAATMRFFAEESCQKCTPCRIGTRALRHATAELLDGRTPYRGAWLDGWLDAMERGSICGLGQAAPTPVRCVRRHWPELLAELA